MARPLPCPERCNVLLIGGGGREHALAWKLRQSPRLGDLWLNDNSNAALAELGTYCPEAENLRDHFRLSRWCDRNNIDLVVIGPEGPLAAGLADGLQTERRQVFGPNRDGARIESDKAYAKQLMRSAAIPTAEARVFTNAQAAIDYINTRDEPLVIKASGLAAGKGVFVCSSPEEAVAAIEGIMIERVFDDAGEKVLIEERLIGQEVSVLALTDGRTLWMLDPCQDHKQVGEGDTGPNTGGMGAYSPAPIADEDTLAVVRRDIMVPIVDALRRDGVDYRGVLYAGLMLTAAGPKVLEFNCRFGDPECQPLMMRLQADLVELLWAVCVGQLSDFDLSFDPRSACCVVMCSAGYPGAYEKGKIVSGVEEAEALAPNPGDIVVFHAGTRADDDGLLRTNGGRVLGVTALVGDLHAARDLANAACEQIHFDGSFFRRDIGDRVLVTT